MDFFSKNTRSILKQHIEVIVIGLVVLTLSPVLLKFAKKLPVPHFEHHDEKNK